MKQIHDNSHLTLEERKIIQMGIENRSRKVDIARTIGKDPTTIAKEIRKHRKLHPRNTFNNQTDCVFRTKCAKCYGKCNKYIKEQCRLRDRTPGACNKCPKTASCHLDKYFYYAIQADQEYKNDLVDFRQGINLTIKEKKELGNKLKPLLDQGQSISQIKSYHPEIKQCKKTLYNYIESGVFKDEGIDNFSLKEQVQRKQFNKKYKKRKQPVNYIGHTYKDFLEFLDKYPDSPITEMDTVINNVSGPYIQTFIFKDSKFMIGFVKHNKTSETMASTLDYMESILTQNEYSLLFGLLLTDRGVEFEKMDLFMVNKNTGFIRTNIFYTDAYCSSQKSHIENNHNYVRDIIPNDIDISNITQDDLNLMFSHINSTPRESMKWKTPYEMFVFLYGKELADKLNIKEIPRDEVTLKPYLIIKNHKK